jgi:hypothetical protein
MRSSGLNRGETTMPTLLPKRRPPEPHPENRDPGFRDLVCAGAFLLMVLGLLCEQRLPPTPGYSLAQTPNEIQLSP